MKNTKDMCRIGELAKLKGVSVQSLRLYERFGLLKPNYIDPDSGYRYYAQEQFIETAKIKFLKMIDFSLREIDVYTSKKSVSQALGLLKEKQGAFEEKIKEMTLLNEEYLRIIKTIEEVYEKIQEDEFYVELREVETFYGYQESYPYDYKDWFVLEKMLYEMHASSPRIANSSYTYSVMRTYDMAVLKEVEHPIIKTIVLPVDYLGQEARRIEKVKPINMGKSLISYHVGPFESIHDSFRKITDYMDSNGLLARDSVYITPIVNRFIIEDSKQHIDKIIIPLR